MAGWAEIVPRVPCPVADSAEDALANGDCDGEAEEAPLDGTETPAEDRDAPCRGNGHDESVCFG